MKRVVSFVLLGIYLICSSMFGQSIPYVQTPEYIKTVQWINPQTNDNSPLIEMGNEYLVFSFDDLEGGLKTYNYTIEFRNADWSEASIFQSEYMAGYNQSYIKDYKFSFNTLQKYTNYRLQIPNREVAPALPGNYLLKVYTTDVKKPIIVKPFSVFRRDVLLGLRVEQYRAGNNPDYNQWVQCAVNSPRLDLTQNPDGNYLVLLKNSNYEEALALTIPQFQQPNQLMFNSPNQLFAGGAEYYWFDTKNIQNAGLSTERIYREETDSVWQTVLRPNVYQGDLVYVNQPDVNGAFYVRNAQLPDETQARNEADYTVVHFALEGFDDQNGRFEAFVVGAFNGWQMEDENRLYYTEVGLWETAMLLKQGYYNYTFWIRDTKTGEVLPSQSTGSFWQTENQYEALFYHRPWGVRYDALIGYGEGNSLVR